MAKDKEMPLKNAADSSVQVLRGSFAQLSEWLEPGALGSANDQHGVLYMKTEQWEMVQVSPAPFVFVALAAAGVVVDGNEVSLGAGGLPTLEAITHAGQRVRISNTTAAAINVASTGGATINGAAAPYALAAGAVHDFVSDASGTNWGVV